MDESDMSSWWPHKEEDINMPAKDYAARVTSIWPWRDGWGVTSLDAVRRLGGDEGAVDDLFTVER